MSNLMNDEYTKSNNVDAENPLYLNIEKRMLDVIRQSKHIEHVMVGDVLDDVTKNKILEMISTPKPFKISDRGLSFINSNGDEEECVNYGTNVTADGRWLSSKIDIVPFDIEQDGNLRKSSEAQAAYCLCVLYCVLNDESIKKDIISAVSNYDFSKMAPNIDSPSFVELLESYQNLQSTSINICVSAAKYNISNVKKDSEKFLKENIPEDRIGGLRELDSLISSINRKYSLGSLSPDRVGQLTKLEVLAQLDKRNQEIALLLDGGTDKNGSIYNSHKEATLWRILNLSSEYISPIVKRRLNILAEDEVSKLFIENPRLSLEYNEKKQLSDKWKKRYIKLARLSVRKTQVDKYLSDENSYMLPVKL